MGTVRYKGKTWKGIINISVSSNGEVKLWDYKCPAVAGYFKIPSGVRLKIVGDKSYSLDSMDMKHFYSEEVNAETCILLEGNTKEVICGNLVEVIGDVGRIEEGNVSYIPKEELTNNFKSIRDKMNSGRFNFGEGRRHVIHLDGSFKEINIYHTGLTEIDLTGNVDKVSTTKSILVKGSIRDIRKAKTVKIAK